jgi:hypothetical protein
VRGLFGLVLAACLIGLAGPQPVHAADEAPTPGLWINPKLGLATPEEAAARYKAPFHTWLVDHWKEPEEPDWRRRIFFRFTRHYGDYPDYQRLSRKVASCAVMRTAWRNRFGSTGDKNEPGSLLNGRWSFEILKVCEALEYLSRLRPIETASPGHPDFAARVWTVRHLSPLAYAGFSIESVCKAYRSEVWDAPHLAIQNRGDAHGGGHVFHGVFHRRRWDPALGDGDRVWALWVQDPTVEVAGITISPRFRLESEDSIYFITVYGVGSLSGDERPELIILVTNTAKNGGTHPTVLSALVLAYDAEVEMFRVINLGDFKRELGDYDCLPSERK